MLKALFIPKKAENHPIEMLIIGFFYASISILLGSFIFPEYASLIIIFFTVFSCLYVVQGAIKIEETLEKNYNSEKMLLQKHSKVFFFLLCLFVGFVFAFAFWTYVLPVEQTTNLFSIQEKVVEGIQSNQITGNAINPENLQIIIINNLKVLFLSFVISIFYGAGAVFVLVWNASVMGFVIGTIAKINSNVFLFPIAFIKYFLHGLPEMLSYIIVILAGGIVFASIIKGDIMNKEKTKRIIIDTSLLILLAIILVIVSALIEVYISPLI